MDDINYIEVVKWVLIVLVAGFIGHFGRVLAEYLIDRSRKKRAFADRPKDHDGLEPSVKTAEPGKHEEAEPEKPDIKAASKAEKKARKAEIKLRKKVK